MDFRTDWQAEPDTVVFDNGFKAPGDKTIPPAARCVTAVPAVRGAGG